MPLTFRINTGDDMELIKKIKLHIVIYWAIILGAGILALSFSTGVVSSVVVGLAVVGAIFSIVNSYRNDGYLKSNLALGKNAGRTPVYDYIRCLAVLLVIVVHVIGVDLNIATDLAGTTIYSNLDFARWWALNCNILFVMLSGALLLPYKQESMGAFYVRRLTKIVIPLVIYYIWYLVYFGQRPAGQEFSVFDIIKGIATADLTAVGAYHFWLLYVIIAVYIFIPFMRWMIKDMPYKYLTGFVIATIFVLSYATYLPLNIGLNVSYLGWCGVAVVGYWCSKEETRKYDVALIILGLAACILMWFVFKYDPSFSDTLWNLSPYRLIASMGIFAIFFKVKDHLKSFYVIRLVSKYSFSIMLIHYWIIGNVLRKVCGIGSVMYMGMGAVISVVVTLLISLIGAYLIDNLIVITFTSIVDELKKIKIKRA